MEERLSLDEDCGISLLAVVEIVIFVEKGRGLKNNDYICGRITDERYE